MGLQQARMYVAEVDWYIDYGHHSHLFGGLVDKGLGFMFAGTCTLEWICTIAVYMSCTCTLLYRNLPLVLLPGGVTTIRQTITG